MILVYGLLITMQWYLKQLQGPYSNIFSRVTTFDSSIQCMAFNKSILPRDERINASNKHKDV